VASPIGVANAAARNALASRYGSLLSAISARCDPAHSQQLPDILKKHKFSNVGAEAGGEGCNDD
jgi:hypothetical protein